MTKSFQSSTAQKTLGERTGDLETLRKYLEIRARAFAYLEAATYNVSLKG